MTPLRFGVFVPPHHVPVSQNPTYCLDRDVKLIQELDAMGFDEAWFGEHHSSGVELSGDPLMMIAHVAQVTKHIRLGAGVVSLPYHNPFMVADRFTLLDHLTRGRAMLGVGPGALATDALQVGLDPSEMRDALETDVGVLIQLLRTDDPVTIDTGRYRLVEARLQLDAFTYPHAEVATAAMVSPSGPRLVGKYGLGMISIGATMSEAGFNALGLHWDVVEERAQEFGQSTSRDTWRLVGPMHLAETKDEAIRQVEYGLDPWFEYMQRTNSAPQMAVEGTKTSERIEFVRDSGMGLIGTPEEAISRIEQLQEQSNGGFGSFLLFAHNWASWEDTLRSYHLFANRVMPQFKGTLRRLRANEAWARANRDELHERQRLAIEAFKEKHAREKAAAERAS